MWIKQKRCGQFSKLERKKSVLVSGG